MSILFLFALLAPLIMGQALQHESVDNDTFILNKVTLEDIFGTGNIDKRMLKTEESLSPLRERISVPLMKSEFHYWYIEVPAATSDSKFRFEIDTYGICSIAPSHIDSFWVGSPESKINCPDRPFRLHSRISGCERQGKIAIHETFTWKGLLMSVRGIHGHGTLGWTLDDSRVPERLHSLPTLLSEFRFPVFAMYLTNRTGEAKVDIGGVDDNVSHVEYHKVVKTGAGHQPWLIGSLHIFVGSEMIVPDIKAGANIKTAFDSTKRHLIGPPSQVAKIKAKIRAEGSMVYFQWSENGHKWSLQPADPNHDPTSQESWSSYANLLKPGHSKMDRWDFGEPFWTNKYMVFYKDSLEPQVGIGELLPSYDQLQGPSYP